MDGQDASEISKYIVGKATLTADERKRADVNGDGNVNSIDVSLILRYDVGAITKFPVEY